jgi:acetyl esterase/lipase
MVTSEDRSILTPGALAPEVVVSYGDHEDQVAEVWPSTPSSPLVVVLHGGFWQQAYDRAHCRPLAAALAQRGATVMLLEYRRVGGAGGWPHTFDDVRVGLRRLVQHHPQASRRVVVGHSAGGHLALWVAATEPTPVVDAVVALAPVADLGAMAAHFGSGENPVVDLLGGDPDERPDRYDLADPVRLPSPHAEVQLVHGLRDTLVPVEQSRRYLRAHPTASLTELDCAHFELIDPRSTAFAAVRAAVDDATDAGAAGVRTRPW